MEGHLKDSLFAICVCLSYNMEGAHFVIIPTVFAKLFGAKGGIRVFSVGFSFIAVASLLNIFILSKFLDGNGWYELGFSGISYVYALFSSLALCFLIFKFKEEKVHLKHYNISVLEPKDQDNSEEQTVLLKSNGMTQSELNPAQEQDVVSLRPSKKTKFSSLCENNN